MKRANTDLALRLGFGSSSTTAPKLAMRCGVCIALLAQWLAIVAAGAAPYKEIETAVRNDDLTGIQSMISADGGSRSDTAALCLMVASLWDKPVIVEKLLSAGISPNASPVYAHEAGETPLTYAILGAHETLAALLLGRGANPNYRGDCRISNCRGRMPLDLAVKCGLLGTARRLLEAGADPNAGQNFAVQTANQQGDVKMFQLLLAYGGRLPSGDAQPGAGQVARKSQERFHPDAPRTAGLAELLPPAPGVPVSPQRAGPCRLAIIGEDGCVTAADLLVAQLAAHPSVELIERQELDRVFAEKRLTRQFAAQVTNYSSVGTLLRADALLLIRTRDLGGSKAVEARFIRVHPGIVLDTVYRAAPLANPRGWAEEMGARVAGLAGKAVASGAICLSVLDVHAALPTPLTVGLERTLTVLLRDRLVHDPRFVVLERAEMETVAFENAGEKPFWTGSYLVDPLLDAALDNSGNFSLSLQLRPTGKGATVSAVASGRRADLGRAIDELMQQVHSRLGGPEARAPRRDLAAEANSYLEEARWALAARMPARAEAAAEVAWALGLQTLDVARLRIRSAQEAVQDAVRNRRSSNPAPASEPLEFAIHAVGLWDDVLQGGLLHEPAGELRPWLESTTNLANVVTLSIISVGPATEQIQQSDRLRILRRMSWDALDHALLRARELPASSGLPELISRTQLGIARLILPEEGELRAALQGILLRGFATNDHLARAALRLSLHWLPSMKIRIDTYSGPAEITYRYPNNDPVKEWLLDSFRKSPARADHFLASAIEFDGWVTLPAERTALLMEKFWGMRDELAQDGELFKLYFGRLHSLIENEPITGEAYVPRNYRLRLEQGRSGGQAPCELTRFEFYRRLYLYLIERAPRPEPPFDDLVGRYTYRYSPEQRAELQQAYARYAERTGARAAGFFAPRPEARPIRQAPPAPAPDTLPPLRVSRFWHPFDLGRNISPDFRFEASSMIWAEDRLWFGGSVHDFYSNPQVMRNYVFAVDPLTLQTETIELPVIPITPQAAGPVVPHGVRFAVRPGWLVVAAAHDFFALYDRAGRRWQIYSEIQPARVERPEIIGDAAYLIVEDGSAVLRFDLKQRTTRLLASSRRRPAASPLDDPSLWFSQIWKDDAGDLMVIAQSDHDDYLKIKSVVQAWSPTTQTWKPVEGPARVLKLKPPSTTNGRLPRANFLAQAGLEVAGAATADGRARGSGLALRLRNQVKPFDNIPLVALPKAPLRLPDNRYGGQNLAIRIGYECPAGYIFPPWPGAGFWFLPKTEFDDYVRHCSRPVETARP